MNFPVQYCQSTAFLTCNYSPCAYGVQADDHPGLCSFHRGKGKTSPAVLTVVCNSYYAAERQMNGMQLLNFILFKSNAFIFYWYFLS